METLEAKSTIVCIDRQGHKRECSLRDIEELRASFFAPVREAPAYKGQRHLPGRYWFSTTEEHVIYESRMEMKSLLILDFQPNVLDVVAQPFAIIFPPGVCGKKAKLHIPDYLVYCREGSNRLLDVKPLEYTVKSANRIVFDATRRACEEIGWDYEVLSEQDPVLLANVEWLAGFRRQPALHESIGPAAMKAVRALSELRFGELLRILDKQFHKALVRPVVLHLMWRQELSADLSVPLSEETPLYVEKRKEMAYGV